MSPSKSSKSEAMTEALSRHTDDSACVKDVRKLAAKLNSDLKVWVAHKYGLISAGKPESGMMPQWRTPPERWDPSDVEFATAWDNWLRKSQERTDCEALKEELAIWEKGAAMQGANQSTVEVSGTDAAATDKGWPWKKIMVGGAVALGAYWFFFRDKGQGHLIAPIVTDEEPARDTDYQIVKEHGL
jgi:hypothetical protein